MMPNNEPHDAKPATPSAQPSPAADTHSNLPPVIQRLLAGIDTGTPARLLELLASQNALIVAAIRRLPGRVERAGRQMQLLIDLIDDYRQGVYTTVPWGSVVMGAAALLYVVSPIDLLPLPIPFVGAIDDALVLTLTMRVLRRDLEAYCQFKGYPVEHYFGPR